MNRIRRSAPRFLLQAILISLLFLLRVPTQPAQAAVSLVYFTAKSQDAQVSLEWQTASEMNNAGFFVTRSDQNNGSYNRISPFIPAQGDSLVGATYDFSDSNVTNGVEYWYKLESVDFGQNSTFYGPISAIPGVATATPTATSTLTPTATATQPSGQNGTPTLTPTLTPTGTGSAAASTPTMTATPTAPTASRTSTPTSNSAYPPPETGGSATFTPTVFSNSSPQISATLPESAGTPIFAANETPSTPTEGGGAPTATLIPLPSLTLIFPEQSNSAIQEAATPTPSPGDPGAARRTTSGRFLTLGLVLLIWVVLGAWFYFAHRRSG